jgi:hypothetical protein
MCACVSLLRMYSMSTSMYACLYGCMCVMCVSVSMYSVSIYVCVWMPACNVRVYVYRVCMPVVCVRACVRVYVCMDICV